MKLDLTLLQAIVIIMNRLFDVWLSHNEERVVHSVLLAKQLISEALPLVDTETTSFIITLTVR